MPYLRANRGLIQIVLARLQIKNVNRAVHGNIQPGVRPRERLIELVLDRLQIENVDVGIAVGVALL